MNARRIRLLLAVAAAVVSLGAGSTDDVAQVSLTGDVGRVGHIDLVAKGGSPDLRIVEDTESGSVAVPSSRIGDDLRADVDWSCAQTTRTFRAVADRGPSSQPYVATTPGCDSRLRLEVPERVLRGGNLRVKLRDLWRIGNVWALLCVQPPSAPRTCESVQIPEGQFLTNRVVSADTAGRWVIEAGTYYQQFKRTVKVSKRAASSAARPTILTTGDSLMLTPTQALRRATAGRAKVVDDVYPSAGLQKPFVVDWDTLPAKQVQAYHPDATVLTLGVGDGRPIGEVECCGERWVTAYAQRAHEVMLTYSQAGTGAVVWLNVPQTRDAPPGFLAQINRALALAAEGLYGVEVLDVAAIFTPDGTFRQTMRWHGHPVRVRENDGVHLTRKGARIAATAIRRALARLGVAT